MKEDKKKDVRVHTNGVSDNLNCYLIYPALIVFGLLIGAGSVWAAEMRQIELTDGSVISGEIVSLSQGVYTVRSGTLGTIKIRESKIRSIRMQGAGGQDSGDQVNSVQQRMMGDSDIMGIVQSLQNDPDFQEVLQDPQIVKAVQEGNIAALMANPKIMKLMNKQAVQQIKNKMSQ